MLNALTKLISLYQNSLGIKRKARRTQIQADLEEAKLLAKKIASLQGDVEQEEAELQTYLQKVSEED
jgi:F0F1-type ATP synthase membrane subunit b/b'